MLRHRSAGYIASTVVHYLLACGFRVRGTVRDSKNEKKTAFLRALPGSERLELVSADLTSDAGWDEAVKDCPLICT
jgi:nucleoside-diphosphate-sugar epimerase